MSEQKNGAATVNRQRTNKKLWDKFAEYVENTPYEIYIDYRDELSQEQVTEILAGNKLDVIDEIEDSYFSQMEFDDIYWKEMAENLDVGVSEVEEWLQNDGYYPTHTLDDYDFSRLMRGTRTEIAAIATNAEYNFESWAYGNPVNYSDVRYTLKVLGINPLEFKNKFETQGHRFKGWFPDLKNRVAKVCIDDLEPQGLFNGTLVFCLGNLENVVDVLDQNKKKVTFKAGTNIVIYDYLNGAGITETELLEDVEMERRDITFRNDNDSTYGIESCYGFGNNFWAKGEMAFAA